MHKLLFVAAVATGVALGLSLPRPGGHHPAEPVVSQIQTLSIG